MMRRGGRNGLRGYKWRGRKIQEEVGVDRARSHHYLLSMDDLTCSPGNPGPLPWEGDGDDWLVLLPPAFMLSLSPHITPC
eukprot:scaffold912_cov121-Skeletonema_dohrnii-CCMP3373.AAC.10